MPKIRHLAFVCEDPTKIAEFLHTAFDLNILYTTEPSGTVVLSDGDINITLLKPTFAEHDPALWHFGIQMSEQELAARKPLLESLGAQLNEGVRDGRPVEAFLRTPEGHRIDLAPFWPTQPGQRRRDRGQAAEPAPAAAGASA
jgi:hypothetical protein